MALTLKINPADLLKVKLLLAGVKNGAPTVLARAVNKGLDGASPEVKAAVMATTNIKSTVVGQQVKTAERATPQHIKGRVVIGEGVYGRGKGVALIDFKNIIDHKNAKTKRGISVLIKKGRPKVNLQQAFIATMKSGHKGVFARAGFTYLGFNGGKPLSTRYSKKQGKWVPKGTSVLKPANQRREAINEIFSTSVPDALINDDAMVPVLRGCQGRLDNELDRQLNLLLSKL